MRDVPRLVNYLPPRAPFALDVGAAATDHVTDIVERAQNRLKAWLHVVARYLPYTRYSSTETTG